MGCLTLDTPVAAMDIAEAMCRSHEAVVEQSLNLRNAGVPVASAEDMARSAYNLDHNLFSVLISSIRLAYKNPDGMQQALANGKWREVCVQKVRGY